MVPERDVDPAELYDDERLAFVSLLRSLPAHELDMRVPATPLWTAHDVLAHVVGITADLNAQRFGDGSDPDGWTAAQIQTRLLCSVDDLAAEWEREASAFEAGLRLFGYSFGAHYLGDLLQHVCDVHVALRRPSTRNDLAIGVGLDFYLESFEETLDQERIGLVTVSSDEDRWTLGRGREIAGVRASRYELFRSLGGRRTEAEIRSLDWSGDADAIVDRLSRYPPPTRPIPEL